MTSSDQDATFRVITGQGPQEVRGTLLGTASSRVSRHNHDRRRPCPPYRRCSACRWTEITVVRSGERYVLISEGFSDVEGEIPYGKVSVASTAYDAVRRLHRQVGGRGEYHLPAVARKALVQAAGVDPEFREEMRVRGYLG